MKKRLLSIVAGLGLLLAANVSPAYAWDISFCGGNVGVRLYSHGQLEGTYRTYCGNSVQAITVSDASSAGFPDNYASSLIVRNLRSNQDVRFYDLKNFGGATLTYFTDYNEYNLASRGTGWSDRISSFRTIIQ